jgi:hypothetical protein
MIRTLLTAVIVAAAMGATAARADPFERGEGERHGRGGWGGSYRGGEGWGRHDFREHEYREHEYREHHRYGLGYGQGYRAPVLRGHSEWRVVPRWVPGFPQQIFVDGYWQTVPGQGHWENRSEQVWVAW